jgi:acyl carrier protein
VSTRVEAIVKATEEWLSERGYISKDNFDENASLGLDSFGYLAFILHLEDMFHIEINAHSFFEQDLWERDETFISLCQRLKKSLALELVEAETARL